MNGFDFPVDLQKSQVMTLSDSVTMSHGNSPSQDGRNNCFFAWRLFCTSSSESDCFSPGGGAAGVPEEKY